MIQNVLITGASGFAGKSLAKYLNSKDLSIVKTAYKNKPKKGIKIDLTKKIIFNKSLDCIIHTAAIHKIKDFKKKPKLKYKENILMVKNLISYSKQKKIKKFIYYSTIDINYFPFPALKIKYINSKIVCEKMLINAFKKKIFNKLIILRLPAIVGEKSNDNFIQKAIINLKKNKPVSIWNKNNKYNNLIFIKDLNNLIYKCLKNNKNKQKTIIDCLSSKPVKLKNLILLLKKKLQSKSKIKYVYNKKKFNKIKFNKKYKYNFLSVNRVINQLI